MSSNGQRLYDRRWRVVVGTADVSNLRCVFKAKRSLKPEPNTAEVKIYNLSEATRSGLTKSGVAVLRLEVGYKATGTSQIFLGQVRNSGTVPDGPDVVTTVTTGDGEKEIASAKIRLTVGPSVPVDTVLRSIAAALGVGSGNVERVAARLKANGSVNAFAVGRALSGSVKSNLDDFCRSAGLEWSVQDGALQILDLNKPLANQAVLLSASTGMVGSPTVDLKGIVKAKAFLIPELVPGRKVVFDSRIKITGGYRIEHVEYSGDTHGTEWYADMDLKKYS